MTVAELIKELQKIEDKNIAVCVRDAYYGAVSVNDIYTEICTSENRPDYTMRVEERYLLLTHNFYFYK